MNFLKIENSPISFSNKLYLGRRPDSYRDPLRHVENIKANLILSLILVFTCASMSKLSLLGNHIEYRLAGIACGESRCVMLRTSKPT